MSDYRRGASMPTKFLVLVVYVAWLLALTACASSNNGTPVVTALPSATSTTPAPTDTERPTVLPSPIATPDLTISLANAKQLKLLRQLGPSPVTVQGISGMVPSPDGKLIAVSWAYNPKFELWDINTGQVVKTLDTGAGSLKGPYYLVFSPDGKTLASVRDVIQVWDLTSDQLVRTFAHKDATDVIFSRDGKNLIVALSNGIVLWNIASGKEVLHLAGQTRGRITLSPSGEELILTSLSPTSVRTWDLETGKLVQTTEIIPLTHPDAESSGIPAPTTAKLSQDGKIMAIAYDDGMIEIWNTDNLQGRILDQETRPIYLAFSPLDGGKVLVVGSGPGRVALLNSSGKTFDPTAPSFFSPREDETIETVSFSPDGKYILSASRSPNGDQGVVYVWGIQP